MQYSVGGKNYTFEQAALATMKAPKIEINSTKPTVTVTNVSTNANTDRYYLTSDPSSLNVITGSYNNIFNNGYGAVVYMYVSAQTGTLDQEQVKIKYPTVTLGLTGVPTTHAGAEVTIGNASQSDTKHTFTFSAGSATASSTIGAGVDGVFNEGILGLGSGVDSWPDFYPAGKQTISQIKIAVDGVNYVANLSANVVINNPQYPIYAMFQNIQNIDSTYTGSTPANVYTQDGETIVIKLPDATTGNVTISWTEDMSTTTSGEFEVQSTTTRNVYTQRTQSSGCSSTTYYTPYIETTTISTASSSTTTWVRTRSITGWKIGSNTYAPGETVTLKGNETITAVVGYTDGTKTTSSTTTTRTEIAYTANGAETTTKPSGDRVTSVDGSTTDEVS